MITLERNSLVVRFPEVHPKANLSIEFQRTLRVPDDNREYSLPAGFGPFPMRHVDDFADRLPSSWRAHGGVILPMYQSEALWINFSSAYPMAVKVAAGKINAVTGDPYTNDLSAAPQDYLVVPEQPWLDGFCIQKGVIRQFVAMPLGEGYTAEEQLTAHAEHGGIQLIVYPMRKEVYSRLFETRVRARTCAELDLCVSPCKMEMGLAPGGMIRQQIHDDPHGLEAWDTNIMSRCFIHLANSLAWQEITGDAPPSSPVTKAEYEDLGIPWFDFYFADDDALEGSSKLAGLDSVAAKSIKKGVSAEELASPVVVGKTIDLSRKKAVREGEF